MGPMAFGESVLAWGDAHSKAGEADEHKRRHDAIGHLAIEYRPSTLLCGGDQFDNPSLAGHNGSRAVGGNGSNLYHQGKRLGADIEAGKESIRRIEAPINEYNKRQRRAGRGHLQYKPRKVFLLGNHEKRIDKVALNIPEIADLINVRVLLVDWLKKQGWDVWDGEEETFWHQGVGFRHRYKTAKDTAMSINTAKSTLPRSGVWWHSHIPGQAETRYDGIVNQYACLPCYKPDHLLGVKEHNGIAFLNDMVGDGSFSLNVIPYRRVMDTYAHRVLRSAA
ncbi:MAG: hypothetical protein MEQ74_05185 [Paracoccus sp.]|nr:hypothetical protein [Paracoccus sp. (in: a-proteobacteria)]